MFQVHLQWNETPTPEMCHSTNTARVKTAHVQPILDAVDHSLARVQGPAADGTHWQRAGESVHRSRHGANILTPITFMDGRDVLVFTNLDPKSTRGKTVDLMQRAGTFVRFDEQRPVRQHVGAV